MIIFLFNNEKTAIKIAARYLGVREVWGGTTGILFV
jgi:hypothetical protein